MNECGVVLQGLHEIRSERLLQEHGHCPLRLQITRVNRFLRARVAHHNAA